MKLFSVILLACIAVGSCDDSSLSSSRIVGGTPAAIATFNYVVQLRRDHFGTGTWHQQCGGVLIHARLVLSNALCFEGTPNLFRWRVGAGTASRLEIGTERLVTDIFYNPYFNPLTLQNNLAIVQLLTEMPLGANIALAPLAAANAALPTGNVIVLGWGANVFNGIPTTLLQSVTVPVALQTTCVANYANVHYFVGANNICVGTTTGICTRDEGGPLVFNNVVHGIASFIYGCGNTNFPGVFTVLAPFRPWIDTVIAGILS